MPEKMRDRSGPKGPMLVRLLLAIAVLGGVLAVAGCGGSSSSSSSGSSSSEAESTTASAEGEEATGGSSGGKAAAEKEFAKLQKGSSETVESAKYGPVKAPASLNLFFISCPQSIGGCATGVKNFEAVSKAAGYSLEVCDVAKGTPEEFQKCMQEAIAKEPDYIVNNSTPPAQAPAAYKLAHEKEIPIVGQFSGYEPEPEAGNTFEGGYMSAILGEAITAGMIAESESETPEVLQMVDTIYNHSAQFAEGVHSGMEKYCPECTLEDIEYEATNIETTVPSLIQTTVQQHKDAEWLFTGAVAFTGVLAANSARTIGDENLKIAGFNAEAPNLALLKKCEYEHLDIAIGTPEISWVVMDLIVRDAAGKPVPGGIENPTYKILTCEEPNAYPGPEGFENQFLELWGKS